MNLRKLEDVRWNVLQRTYGSCHSTLTGLMVQWWIDQNPEHHTALEGGPGNGFTKAGTRGVSDAMFCFKGKPIGVLEVEGTRYHSTAKKIGTFFAARRPQYQDLMFAILLLYTYQPEGRGDKRRLPKPFEYDAIFDEVKKVSTKYPDKQIFLLGLDREFERSAETVRGINDYYQSVSKEIRAYRYKQGLRGNSRVIWRASPI